MSQKIPQAAAFKSGEALLKTLPHDVIMRAKLLVSSLLLPEGSIVLDMECGTGTLTAAMAALQPRLHFIGVEPNTHKITRARTRFQNYQLNNLTFELGDITTARRPEQSVDAIVNARVLGEVFTRSNYDEGHVHDMLKAHMRMLKPDGLMLIYDYPMPDEDAFVHMEFPVPERSTRHFRLYGTPLGVTQGEREIALLEWFAQNARAQDAVRGFYLEELPPYVPYTRLFRLPAKWAYEFIIRKQNLRAFKTKTGHQYTAFTPSQMIRTLGRDIGARVLYSAPVHSQHVVRAHFKGSFRLYSASGKVQGYPPVGQLYVVQKMQNQSTAYLTELRPDNEAATSLNIQALIDEETGALIDVVSRDMPVVDIIPYYHTPNDGIRVVLEKAAHKPLANTVPRSAPSIDGKYWSGHMVAALGLGQDLLPHDKLEDGNFAAKIMQKHFGLRALNNAAFERGPCGYAAPELIDERSQSLFIEIEPLHKALSERFVALEAQDVLRATGSGFIPSAWLDIQMQALLKAKDFKITPWLHEAVPLAYDPPPDDQMLHASKFLRQKTTASEPAPLEPLITDSKGLLKTMGKFRLVRGRAGQVAAMRSSFAEKDHKGRALRAKSHDFATPEASMLNMAAVLPLTQDLQGNTLVGFEFKPLPVPSRFGQESEMMNLPTLPLPAHITDIEEARLYVAEQFGVEPDRVAKMGESFFTQIDMTPQRVFPFCLTRYPHRRNARMRFTTLGSLYSFLDPDYVDSFLWYWGLSFAYLCQESQQSPGYAPRKEAYLRKTTAQTPKYSVSEKTKVPFYQHKHR